MIWTALGCWQPALPYKSTGALSEWKSELIICNMREGRQSSGQPYSANCRTFQLPEPFTSQEYSWYRLSQVAHIIELFIFKWVTAKLHPWKVFIVHTVLWKSSPAWQSVTCTKHMVIKSRVRDSNCQLHPFRRLQQSCYRGISSLLAETLKVQVAHQTMFPAQVQINIVSLPKMNIFF